MDSFYGCTSLEKVKLPASLEIISEYAFADCTSLKEITLPANLKTIAADAFDGCTGLKVNLTKEQYAKFSNLVKHKYLKINITDKTIDDVIEENATKSLKDLNSALLNLER